MVDECVFVSVGLFVFLSRALMKSPHILAHFDKLKPPMCSTASTSLAVQALSTTECTSDGKRPPEACSMVHRLSRLTSFITDDRRVVTASTVLVECASGLPHPPHRCRPSASLWNVSRHQRTLVPRVRPGGLAPSFLHEDLLAVDDADRRRCAT